MGLILVKRSVHWLTMGGKTARPRWEKWDKGPGEGITDSPTRSQRKAPEVRDFICFKRL